MAEVVVQQGDKAASGTNSVNQQLSGVFNFFSQYWVAILAVIIILVIAVIVVWLIYRYMMKKKREDIMFVNYENALNATQLNGKKEWIVKSRRWKLLLWGFVTGPLFALIYLILFAGESWVILFTWVVLAFLMWLPIAWIFYKDFSIRIIGVDKTTFGYYRGHARRMDGFIYYAVKVGRKWLILDDIILVRMPENVRTIKTTVKIDKDTGNKTKKHEWDSIIIKDAVVENENGWYIFIPFTSVYKDSSWYYEFSLVDAKGRVLDLRQKIAMHYHLLTQVQMAEQEYSHLGKVTNQAVDTNVGVTAQKKMPVKERDAKTSNDDEE